MKQAKQMNRQFNLRLSFNAFMLCTLLLITPQISDAGDYENGIAAYRAGDYDKAIKLLSSAGNQGNAKAQYYLSVLYEGGSGIDKDMNASLRWLKRAAEGGMVEAQRNLGTFFHDGIDDPDDDIDQAIYWYQRAASQGDLTGQLRLGILLDREKDTAFDHREAIRWYLLAARQGVAQAQYNLGVMHSQGRGTPINPDKALNWFFKAAKQRYTHAMVAIGDTYLSGKGVPQSNVEAYKWFQLADINGHETIAHRMKEIATDLTSEQIKKAEHSANVWLTEN
ncbi:tetratricopeptide repeat protein [Kiloniella sp. EL199]|uniref:tetratricopeptide repeat protein n=1 Tax=Kiloniella sp. EL199 TaxID=2107581 RepID=UPI000EA3AC59|nr:tetratricopeptide repeat protein [Kiloniella sp. EL199]